MKAEKFLVFLFFFFNFNLWGNWYPLFRNLADSVHGFQSQGDFIIAYALLSHTRNDPKSHLWLPGQNRQKVLLETTAYVFQVTFQRTGYVLFFIAKQ